MSITDLFSANQFFDRCKDVFTCFLDKHAYSIPSRLPQHKVHKYFNTSDSNFFVLEPSKDNPLTYYMTGFGNEIANGDFIVITDRNSSMTYKVEIIDYYLDPPDLWVASLVKCSYFVRIQVEGLTN